MSWTQLWRTLKAHGVWIIQCLYWQQRETRVRTNFNSEYYPLVALARVPVCPCARVPVCPGQRQVQKSRSPEVTRLQAVAVCLLVPQAVSPH